MTDNLMCVDGTPLEHHPDLGLWVKREDMSCPEGPHFSKTRGVWHHVRKRNEELIGVLDTTHSQGGHAVAHACEKLGKRCVVYYPRKKADDPTMIRQPQMQAQSWGAELVPLQAGRSAVLYHAAKRQTLDRDGYMMPNALKLPESIEETRNEVQRTRLPAVRCVLVSASSGTLAAGVLQGLLTEGWQGHLVVHLGYSRSPASVVRYMSKMIAEPGEEVGCGGWHFGSGICVRVVDEGYAYADRARYADVPPFPSNMYYDLKAYQWWLRKGRQQYGEAMMWNIG